MPPRMRNSPSSTMNRKTPRARPGFSASRCAVSLVRPRSIRPTASKCEGQPMRDRMNVYFPPALLKQIADLADRKGLSRSAIVEAAVASFLSPDGADRREAAFTRRLDRLTRQVQRLERNVGHLDRDAGAVRAVLAHHHAAAAERRAGRRADQGPRAIRGVHRGARAAVAERAEPASGDSTGHCRTFRVITD